MTIQISRALIKELPEDQRSGIEDYLWAKSNERCFLCEESLNRSSDTIVADHDVPAADAGPTDRDNLNLSHKLCNSVKRNNPSVSVRPYLKVRAFIKKNHYRVQYDKCIEMFEIVPHPVHCTDSGESFQIEYSNGEVESYTIYSEKNDKGKFRYVYANVPAECLYNDAVQPRNLKPDHLWQIYYDMHLNPLYEAPGCRIAQVDGATHIVMFDGQHKSIANWMMSRDHIVVKLYLDMTRDQAVFLVNSIQSKIGKLPLSPFEVAAKLSEEWQSKIAEYEQSVGSDASEKGFIDWLPSTERRRGREALRAALVDEVLSTADFAFHRLVKTPESDAHLSVTENVLKTKVLERLIHLDPLDVSADAARELRAREATNIVRLLNTFVQRILEPDGDDVHELTERQREKARRMLYQASLVYICHLLFRLMDSVAHPTHADRAMMERELTPEQWGLVEQGVDRLIAHPIWECDWAMSQRTQAVETALRENQEASKAFDDVRLRLSYLLGQDELPNEWYS